MNKTNVQTLIVAAIGAAVPVIIAVVQAASVVGELRGELNGLSVRVGQLEENQTDPVPAPPLEPVVQEPVIREPEGRYEFARGRGWGSWSDPLYCPVNQYVCGLEQSIEPNQGQGDDTAMNAVAFYCCPLDPSE